MRIPTRYSLKLVSSDHNPDQIITELMLLAYNISRDILDRTTLCLIDSHHKSLILAIA
jgi:hypothetical protein